MKAMSFRISVPACLTVALALLASGCGGGEAPPTMKEDFVAKVDKLCAADDRQTAKSAAAFQAAIEDENYDAAAQVVLDLQTYEAAMIDRIEAIDPPEADRVTIDEYISLSKQMSDLDTDIAQAIRAEDKEASDVAEKEGDLLEDRRNRLADDYGFKVCGSGEEAP
jgi:hypothetical protein